LHDDIITYLIYQSGWQPGKTLDKLGLNQEWSIGHGIQELQLHEPACEHD